MSLAKFVDGQIHVRTDSDNREDFRKAVEDAKKLMDEKVMEAITILKKRHPEITFQ